MSLNLLQDKVNENNNHNNNNDDNKIKSTKIFVEQLSE